MDETGMNVSEVENELNKNSGLKGICGKNDFRDMLALKNSGDELGTLAYNMFKEEKYKILSQKILENAQEHFEDKTGIASDEQEDARQLRCKHSCLALA